MHGLLDPALGSWLPWEVMSRDYDEYFWKAAEPGFFKLERLQVFSEPVGNESWVAFTEGRWSDAVRLIEKRKPELASYYERIAERGFSNRRVRIVERPFTSYLQWELHALRLRHMLGGRVRIVVASRIEDFERSEPLPELITIGTEVMYQSTYDELGAITGAFKFTDRELITKCQKFISDLYDMGEDLPNFFDREVADLAPPDVSSLPA